MFRIRIRRTCMFLGLPNPHRDPWLVRGTDPRIRIRIRISNKMSRIRNPAFHYYTLMEVEVGDFTVPPIEGYT